MTHSSPRTCGKSRRQISQAIESVKVEHGATGIIHRKPRRENRRGLALLPVNNSERPIRGGIFIASDNRPTLSFCFSAPKAFGAEKQKEYSVRGGGAINIPPLRGLRPRPRACYQVKIFNDSDTQKRKSQAQRHTR